MFPFIIALVVIAISALVYVQFAKKGGVALDASKFQTFTLTKRTQVSPDTFIFRFGLFAPDQVLGLPIGQHIAIRATCKTGGDGPEEVVTHSYTPISSDDDKGYVDFMIKVYFANVHPKFPHGGRLSQHMHSLKVGDTIEMKGPLGKFDYQGEGKAKVQRPGRGWETVQVDAYAMVAGGTGITPILQLIRAITKNPQDKTKVFLVYGNQTEKDILLRDELDAVAKAHPGQVHVWYTIDRDATPAWKYDTGYVCEEMFRRHLPVPERLGDGTVAQNKGLKSVMALMCGPPPMLQFAVKPNLEKLGFKGEDIFAF